MESADTGDETMTTDDYQSTGSFEIKISAEHGNWLTVGEFIRSIQKPISIYAEEIVKEFHQKLCKDLLGVGKCTSPDDCNQKPKPADLCSSCRHWFKKLGKSHERGNNPSWHKNCNSARWSEDHWELAKFFMPALGNNLSAVKDAESTDLPSLLNVLEWMKDTAFLGKTRVNVDLVRKLRSEVRNTWAHAPKHELTDDEKDESFTIATHFLQDLEKVFPNPENGECLKHLKELNDNGVTNVVGSELQSLLLQRQLLCDIKDEITSMKVEQSSVKNAVEDNGQKLDKLECALSECSQRMSDFHSLKNNINKQFNKFAKELKSFLEIPKDIHEIRESIGQIRSDLAKMNNRQKVEREPVSCLPEKVPMFTGREDEIENVISLLIQEEKAIVSLHGGPGFGKTAVAVVVSHKLDADHDIPVIFSQLSTVSTIDEMIVQLCCDVGVNYEDDPKSSFILWLKNIEKKVVFVLDDIDNLLKERTGLYLFLRLMRKNSNPLCQIVTTSRSSCAIPELSTAEVQVDEMDDDECMNLLNKRCPEQEDEVLAKLAELCGKIPLAMCVASSRFEEFKNSNELLQYLERQPMETLECEKSDQYVYRAINMSYEMLDDDQKEALVRLAVFEGSFDEDAVKAVIDKENLHTRRILENLVCRNLIKRQNEYRYSIHLLIQRFLGNQLKSEKEKEERLRAKLLMVKFYLDLGHELTIKSYSKDGYKSNREALKKEAHNIQNALKICSQQEDTTSDICTSLTRSKIYTTSAKFFSMLIRTVIPGSIVDEFQQCCAKLAGKRKELAIQLNFDCLLAEQERSQSIGKPDKYFKMMKKIKEEFEKHYEELKEDKSLCALYYHQYGRYCLRKHENSREKDSYDLLNEACEYLEKSLNIRKTLADAFMGNADEIYSLSQLGYIWKNFAAKKHDSKKSEAREKAQKYYEQAIEMSENNLGDHHQTSACYKALGDLFLLGQNNDTGMAKKYYTIAKKMREELGLDASNTHANLLNNLGNCLMYSGDVNDAIDYLESARSIVEKLAEIDERKDCNLTKIYKSLARAYDVKQSPQNAVTYAKKALEHYQKCKCIKITDIKKLKQISRSSND